MKLLLILAWFLRCFVKLDLEAFEGSSDQWIVMIFGCVVLLYFTVVVEWCWCFEVVLKGCIVILAGVLKQK